ncbi:MAG: hypothetical protein JWO38_439 [Gemmataceae bacterium]|nr:hypothetical protein [Gemmataceae bacterium]
MPGAEVFRVIHRMVEPPRYAQATDRELLTRYLAERDEGAFEALTRRHARLVQLAVAGVLTDPNDIDDAFQATFLVLVRRARGTEWRTALGPWLYAVAHRVAVKLRAKARRLPGPLGDADPAGRTDRPGACWQEVCDLLHAELDQLPDRYRLPLLLCYLEGQTRDEAAAALGLTVGTVKGRVRRGCDLLRRRLGRRGVTLSAGLMAVVTAPHPVGAIEPSIVAILRGACSPRAFALAREVTMRSVLWKVAAGVVAAAVLVGVGTGMIAAGGGSAPPTGKVAAEPVAPLSVQAQALRYVPPDAAVFVHADASRLWGGPLGKSARAAEPKLFADLAAKAKALFGVTPDDLESITVFIPRIKVPEESEQVGMVFTFRAPFKTGTLTAGFGQVFPKEAKVSVHTPSDRMAVVLVGLDNKYAKLRPADATGPLVPAIQAAASGRHLMVVGSTLANLPDVIRGDNLPPDVRAFRPILEAESITGIVDLAKEELSVEVRVKAATPARAAEAEKALGLLATLLQETLTNLGGKGAGNPPANKDLSAIIKAAGEGLKGAKYTTDGAETRARVSLPAELPYFAAFAAGLTKTKEAAVQAQSINNLKQIALAMHNYHDTNGGLPPAAVVDKTGKPLLSWRVLILPYIEQEPLYKQFKLDEPWDSEHNKKLIPQMPKIYAIPDDPGAKPGETRYRVFVGNGAVFDTVQGVKFDQVTDGTSSTIMAVTAATAVPWTKPDELTFDPDKDMGKLLGPVGNAYQAAYCDGSVRMFAKLPAAKTLNALITRAGGEVIDPDAP